jgi:hypothetical protein
MVLELPDDLRESAYRHAKTNEYAWQRSDALRAAALLASRSEAILGGEAWMLLGEQLYLLTYDREEGYYGWECKPAPGEEWPAFVRRSLSVAQAAINDDQPLRGADVPAEGRVYYNLTWASQSELRDHA